VCVRVQWAVCLRVDELPHPVGRDDDEAVAVRLWRGRGAEIEPLDLGVGDDAKALALAVADGAGHRQAHAPVGPHSRGRGAACARDDAACADDALVLLGRVRLAIDREVPRPDRSVAHVAEHSSRVARACRPDGCPLHVDDYRCATAHPCELAPAVSQDSSVGLAHRVRKLLGRARTELKAVLLEQLGDDPHAEFGNLLAAAAVPVKDAQQRLVARAVERVVHDTAVLVDLGERAPVRAGCDAVASGVAQRLGKCTTDRGLLCTSRRRPGRRQLCGGVLEREAIPHRSFGGFWDWVGSGLEERREDAGE